MSSDHEVLNFYFMAFSCLKDRCKICVAKDDNETLGLLEDAMTELVDSWTDFLMSCEEPPCKSDLFFHAAAVEYVSKF